MGELIHIAERIAGHLGELADRRSIDTGDLAEIVSGSARREGINLYPGVSSYGCHDLAIFISLSSPLYVKGRRGHLSCRQAIEKVVQHMQGSCMNRTRAAVLITDSWDSVASHEWNANLLQIAAAAHLEIYLITGKNISEIHL